MLLSLTTVGVTMFCNGICCFCPMPCQRSIITKMMKEEVKTEKPKAETKKNVEKLQISNLPEVISPVETFDVKQRFGKLIARKTK